MQLTLPSDALTRAWETDWHSRPGYVTVQRRAERRDWRNLAVQDDDGTEIGMIAVCLAAQPHPVDAILDDIWVRPGHRGRGLGRKALELAQTWARDRKATRLRVALDAGQPAAEALFKSYRVSSRHMTIAVGEPQAPTGIGFDPMTAAEYEPWLNRSIRDYAEQIASTGLLDSATALTRAHHTYAELLPDGLDTPKNDIWTIRHDGRAVASLWLLHNDEGETFIAFVEVEEPFRGRGFGRAAMELARCLAAGEGSGRIRLNVFTGNTAAEAMYHNLGYRTTAQFRFIPLPAADMAI